MSRRRLAGGALPAHMSGVSSSKPPLPKTTVHGKPIREWEEDTLDRFLKMGEKLRQEGVIPLPTLAERERVWDRRCGRRPSAGRTDVTAQCCCLSSPTWRSSVATFAAARRSRL